MGNNPWNIIMIVEFDSTHKEELLNFYKQVSKSKGHTLKKKMEFIEIPIKAREYLKNKYEEGYGLKVLARSLDLTYTRIRTLFRYLNIKHRKGYNVATEKTKEFRSYRVKGDRCPWKNWPEKYPELHKNSRRGIQGYYKKRDNSLVYLRSSWEYIFAKWLDKNNIDWKYEYKQYKLSNGEGYRPDFFIFKNNKLKMIVEIKGYYKNRIYKIELFKKEYPDIKIIKISNMSSYTSYSERKEKNEWLKVRLLEKE